MGVLLVECRRSGVAIGSNRILQAYYALRAGVTRNLSRRKAFTRPKAQPSLHLSPASRSRVPNAESPVPNFESRPVVRSYYWQLGGDSVG